MNDETMVPIAETVPELTEAIATEVPETAPQTTDGTITTETTVPESVETFPEDTFPAVTEDVIWEDFSGSTIEETVAVTTEPVIIVEVIESAASDLAHVNLFGSFLISGTLIGLFLLRGIHGT